MIKRPVIPGSEELKSFTGGNFGNDFYGENLFINGKNMQNLVVGDVSLESSLIQKTSFDYSKIQKLKLTDVLMEKASIRNCIWEGAYYNRVEVCDSQGMGLQLTNAVLKSVRFVNVKALFSLFRFAKFSGASFEKCVLSEADFLGAELYDVSFRDCDLERTDFSGAKFKNVDIRGSSINGAKFELRQLQGLIVDPSQVFYLVQLLGVVIQ